MTVATFHDQAALTTDGQAFARWVTLLEPAAALAERIASTDFVPEAMRGNPAAITAAIMRIALAASIQYPSQPAARSFG